MCHEAIAFVCRSRLFDSNVSTIDSMADRISQVCISDQTVTCEVYAWSAAMFLLDGKSKMVYNDQKNESASYLMTRDDCIHLVQMDRQMERRPRGS